MLYIYPQLTRLAMWSKQDKAFVKALKQADTKEAIDKAVLTYVDSDNTAGVAFHKAIIILFKTKATDKQCLEALPIIFDKYKIMYPRITTLRKKLSQVRTQSIKPNQSANVFRKSKTDEFFNIDYEERIAIANESKQRVFDANEKKIQVDVNEITSKMNKLILSGNRYDRLIALMLSIGARPIEIFDKNTFEMVEGKGYKSWIRVNNLAKKREGQKDWTIRPVVGLPREFVVREIMSIRKSFKNTIIINSDGELAKDKAATLNKRVLKHFPWLKDVPQKSSFLRKIYADLSYKNFANRNSVNFNTWISRVLGHGDLLTSFSYSYVNVSDPEELKVNAFQTQLAELRAKIDLALKIQTDNKPKAKPHRLAPRTTKMAVLDALYNDNPRITNAQMRKQSGMGSKLVNEFMKSKKP